MNNPEPLKNKEIKTSDNPNHHSDDQVDPVVGYIENQYSRIINKINELIQWVKVEIKRLDDNMATGKRELKRNIDELKSQVLNLTRKVNDLESENELLKNRLDKIQKHVDVLIGEKVKQETLKHRESHGGQIGVIQHQDILANFRDLKQEANALSNEVKLSENTVRNRGEVRALISRIFIENHNFDDWFNEIFQFSLDNSFLKSNFKSFYDKVLDLTQNMANVNPAATFYIPQVGELYNKDKQVLISEKCNDKSPISIIIFPGLNRGNQLNESAVVYTDLLV